MPVLARHGSREGSSKRARFLHVQCSCCLPPQRILQDSVRSLHTRKETQGSRTTRQATPACSRYSGSYVKDSQRAHAASNVARVRRKETTVVADACGREGGRVAGLRLSCPKPFWISSGSSCDARLRSVERSHSTTPVLPREWVRLTLTTGNSADSATGPFGGGTPISTLEPPERPMLYASGVIHVSGR